ncbi:hypothetical protein [Paenibacillus odorifer]|uniref:Uncharacterized protein n=1 Tax=Paenibacillus odorifer TaxID=189426 RepID=A0A1R0Y021_9BACL|nr:hypothetical protein [Paenibacillus odorifer]OMD40694.1 hypothetical protein BSK52_12550 [Paenibacillus odorifer]
MNGSEFFRSLKEGKHWNEDVASFYFSKNSIEGIRLKFTYPPLSEEQDDTFKLSGYFACFEDNELYTVIYLLGFFKIFSKNIKVYDIQNGIRFEVEMINPATEEKELLVVQFTFSNNEGYNYVQLTGIVIPPFAKFNRLSLMILSLLYLCAKDFEYDLWVVGIVNERWLNTLIHHGGIIDPDNFEDVQITRDFWVFKDDNDRHNYSLAFRTNVQEWWM